MVIRTLLTASSLMAVSCASFSAQAALQGRDLDGNLATFEAYYDTTLNITWLADANYAQTSGYDVDGKMNWSTASAWAASLSFYNPLTQETYGHWRLPAVGPVNGVNFDFTPSFDGSTDSSYNYTTQNKEMPHLFHVTLGNTSMYDTSGTSSGCYVVGVADCFDNQGPFVNLKFPYLYWNDNGGAPTPAEAWAFILDRGQLGLSTTIQEYHAWAVHPGDVGAVPEPETYGLLLAGLGLIGWRLRQGR
jgi:hypothetical protein